MVLFSDLFQKDAVVIKPFVLNSELQSKGYDGQTVAIQLVHDITTMIQEAGSLKQAEGFDVPLSTKLPDVEVPGAGITAKSLLRYVQEFAPLRYVRRKLGFNPIQIEGEASLHGEQLRIDLRILKDVNGKTALLPKTFIKDLRGEVRGIESLFTESSEYILEDIEPYLWAVHLYRNKETEKALTKIQYCMSQNPEHTEFALLLWGLILIDEKKYDEAIAKFEEITKTHNGGYSKEALAGAYNNWGLALLYQGKTDPAIAKFDEAIRLDPNHALTYNNYGKAWLDKDELVKAREKLKQALALDPKLAMAYFHLAYTYWDENPEQAASQLNNSINLDPKYAPAYDRLGLLQATVLSPRQYEKGFANLRKAIELDHDYALAWANLGFALASKAEGAPESERSAPIKEAISALRKAIQLYAKEEEQKRYDQDFIVRYAKANNDLGWAYEIAKDYERAVAGYERAFQISPTYYYALTGKGDALRKWGRREAALATYESVLQQPAVNQPSRLAAYKGEGLLYWQRCPICPPTRSRNALELAIAMFTRAQEIENSDEIEKKLAEAKTALERLSKRAR
jgi:tetratricopeptide (TPR) repeat protein